MDVNTESQDISQNVSGSGLPCLGSSACLHQEFSVEIVVDVELDPIDLALVEASVHVDIAVLMSEVHLSWESWMNRNLHDS